MKLLEKSKETDIIAS